MSIPRVLSYPMPDAATLPDSLVGWAPDPARAVLLIHDMQEYFVDFFDPAQAPVPTLVKHIQQLRARCDAASVPVVYTAQPAEQSLEQRGLLQDWWGPGITARPAQAPVLQSLAPRPHDTVLAKWRYSAFARSDLLERMAAQGRDQLIVCGVYAHIGCLLTTADAFMNDIQPFFVGDAVADFSLDDHRMAMNYVAQRCGVVTDTRRVLDALRPAAPAFTLPASIDALQREVAALLELPPIELRFDDNLLDCGMDSIRLMTLVERWRSAGLTVSFIDMAETPTLNDWWVAMAPLALRSLHAQPSPQAA